MDINEVINKTRNNLLMSDVEGGRLYELGKQALSKGVIVEIGTWKGSSIIWLAGGTDSGNKCEVYTIDLFISQPGYKDEGEDFFEEAKKTIENSGLKISMIRGDSPEIGKNFDKPVSLLFIDGNHEYEKVKQDFLSWVPKVLHGGIIALHDVGGPGAGPTKVTEEFIINSPHFKDYTIYQTLASATKI